MKKFKLILEQTLFNSVDPLIIRHIYWWVSIWLLVISCHCARSVECSYFRSSLGYQVSLSIIRSSSAIVHAWYNYWHAMTPRIGSFGKEGEDDE